MYVLRRRLAVTFAFITRYRSLGDKFEVLVSDRVSEAKKFQSVVAAINYIQPLINGKHPSIGKYEIVMIPDTTDSLEDAYNRAMGVI